MKNIISFLGNQKIPDFSTIFQKSDISLLSKLFWFGGASSLAQLFSIIYSILLARWLLPEGYGVVAGCYAAANISIFFVNWGMDTWLLRQASTDSSPKRLLGTVLKLKGVLGIVWVGGTWLILRRINSDFFLPAILILVLIDTWLDAGVISLSSFFNATQRTRTVSILLASSRIMRLLSAIFLILIGQSSAALFIAIRLFFTIITLSIGLYIARPSWLKSPSISIRTLWISSLPYAGSDLLSTAYAQVDIFLISLLGGKIATGIYAPSVSLINALITMLVSSFWLFVPYLTQLFQQNPEKLKSRMVGLMSILLATGSLVAILLGLLGPWLVNLLLSIEYQASGELLRTLSPILFFKSISVGCAAILVATGLQHQRLLPQLISAGLNLFLNLWVIPIWGSTGAAIVYVFSEIILALGYSIRVVIFFKQTQNHRKINENLNI